MIKDTDLKKLVEKIETLMDEYEDKKFKRNKNEAHSILMKSVAEGDSKGRTYALGLIENFLDSDLREVVNEDTIDDLISDYHVDYTKHPLTGSSEEIMTKHGTYFERYMLQKDSDYENKLSKLAQIVYQDLYGFGIIDEIIHDRESSNEISYVGYEEVYVQMKGMKFKVPLWKFKNEKESQKVLDNITSYSGKTDLNPVNPYAYTHTPAGSRVTGIVPTLTNNPTMFHRNISTEFIDNARLIELGTFNEEICIFNAAAVKGRANISIIGEQGSGKSTLLLNLCQYIPESDWVGTLEISEELRIKVVHPFLNVIPMVYAYSNGILLGEAFGVQLRTNRDRVVIGETRYPIEAATSIDCMLRLAKGSFETFHTSSPARFLYDKRNLLIRSGFYFSEQSAILDVADATNLIYHVRINPDTKQRYLYQIVEISTDIIAGTYDLKIIFKHDPTLNTWIKKNKPSKKLLSDFREIGHLSRQEVETIERLFSSVG